MLNNEDFVNELDDNEAIIIELTDEDGATTEFEYLDTIQLDGEEYIVLIENSEDADGVIILKIESIDDETENYVGVENHADEFDFTD